jgi:pyruvate dehydrogenase E2 component (dihydrolipoamide acetyltransferase)
MFEVKFADIGEGIHEGVIYKFEVEEGQEIKDGDTLFLVETDKVTAEIPSPVSGKVSKVHFVAGDTIHVGETIVTIDDGSGEEVVTEPEAEVEHEIVSEQGSTSVVGDLEISSEVIASSQEFEEKEPIKKKVLATPVARKMAKDLGVDIQTIVGTGPAGRVMKADIKKASETTSVAVKPSENFKREVSEPTKVAYVAGDRREKMSTMRKTIAEHMTRSKFTIPHTAVMDELIVNELVAYREEAKLIARQKNVKLTYLPLIIKAVIVAIKQHEIMNTSLDESTDEIVYKKDINIGIAVDTPYGLMVPVIKQADKLSVLELANAVEDLSSRAQSKSLSLDEISGSTFTITNYGAFGSSFGVPVINYPDSAILGIGKIDKKPVVIDDEIQVGYVLPLSMSFDHRVIDGADAGRFMNTLKSLLINPQLLLLS